VQPPIRLSHQRLNYSCPPPQGSATAEVTTYDTGKIADDLLAEGCVFRGRSADGQQIQVSEMSILRNDSQPPPTRMGDWTFEVVLAEGAKLDDMAVGSGGCR